MVLTDEFAVTLRPGLAKLSGVNILSYNTSGTDEMAIRQEVREFQRAVGLSSMRDIFGLPKHSHPLLHNTEVRRRIQVRTYVNWVVRIEVHCSSWRASCSPDASVKVKTNSCDDTLIQHSLNTCTCASSEHVLSS